MPEAQDISMEDFQTLVRRAGHDMTAEELEALKPMYDHYARQLPALRELDLDAEDLAVTFVPDVEAQS